MTLIKNHFHFVLLAIVVLFSFGLMLNASFQESATMDELAHIPAGYGYVKYLDFRLNPEHPPLTKAIAALPLIFQNLNFPTDESSWQTDINGQWATGAQFLYESGNDADKIIQWSRFGPMLLTIILLIFIYIWAKDLLGRWWALLPVFLFALSPTVLAHGHYVTTDIGAALGIFIALYYFIKFLSIPSQKHLFLAGVAFGIAQLLKFSAVLLMPFFIFLMAVFYIHKTAFDWKNTEPAKRFKRFSIRAFRFIRSALVVFIIGYVIVYAVYFAFTVNYPVEKQKSDAEFILTSFGGGPTQIGENCKPMRCLANANIWMSSNKFLRPLGEYMLGVLMVIQRSSGGNTGYFLGEVSASGWWHYFPVLFALKEPIPSLILILFAFTFSVWLVCKKLRNTNCGPRTIFSDYLALRFAEFSILSFVIFYWIYSMKSPLNIGIRHMLPTMPLIYILTTSAVKKIINTSTVKKVLLAALLLWFALETFSATPYFLSYFNQFGGGIWNGYKYAVDSNYDWGQDLKRLKKFVEKPPVGENIDRIAVDYFGGGNPKYYLGAKTQYWRSSYDNPIYENIKWLAVSVNTLQGALGTLHAGQTRNPEDEYQWLPKIKNPYKPDFRAGTSIFIYKLD
jgi:4-amino-4-deoxy-L-arabinose transferase-like glycosyltransferase